MLCRSFELVDFSPNSSERAGELLGLILGGCKFLDGLLHVLQFGSGDLEVLIPGSPVAPLLVDRQAPRSGSLSLFSRIYKNVKS